MKLKQRFLLIWYYFTFQEIGYKAMARELMPKQSVGFFLMKIYSKKETIFRKIINKFGKLYKYVRRR